MARSTIDRAMPDMPHQNGIQQGDQRIQYARIQKIMRILFCQGTKRKNRLAKYLHTVELFSS